MKNKIQEMGFRLIKTMAINNVEKQQNDIIVITFLLFKPLYLVILQQSIYYKIKLINKRFLEEKNYYWYSYPIVPYCIK